MAFFFESWASELLAVALVLLSAVYAWYKRQFTYWTKKGLKQADPVIPFGNVKRFFLGQTRLEFEMEDIYNKFKDEKCVGIYLFNKPALLLIDPELIRLIMVKDFESFTDRNVSFDEKEPANHHLFNLNGAKWKRLRAKMSPVFTTGKLKMMSQTMQDCGRQMVEVLEGAAERKEVLEMREISARYSTDVIASVAFGIESDCQRSPETVFRQMGRKIFDASLKTKITDVMYKFFPAIAKALRMSGGVRPVINYFRKLVQDTMEYREANEVFRSDFMQLMIQMKNKGIIDDKKTGIPEVDNWKFSVDDVLAQSILFYAAGFETSSTTMSFALHELAVNPEIQRRLQDEVEETMKKYNGQLSYQAISEMQYLDKVLSETLRKHPPGGLTARKCVHDYQLPNGIVIEKGTEVFIPMYALQMDPKYFPEPKRFNPERFSQEEKSNRPPYVYMPFGEGPRNCIGMRLGLLQAKVGLSYLMSRYGVERCELTKDPLQYSMTAPVLASSTGIQLRLVKKA